MRKGLTGCGGWLAALTLGCAPAAYAEFADAMKDYGAGNFTAAQTQFLALAELGDCASQFNLGAMALKGQGGARDRGAGVGWLEAALSNGCRQQVGDKVPALRASLTPEESRAAQAVLDRYGREALQARGIAAPQFSCPGQTAASVLQSPAPEYPRHVGGAPEAIVITALTIGADGRAYDPEVLLAVPEPGFAAATIEAWLNARFAAAQRDGQAVASRLEARQRFRGASGNLASEPSFKAALAGAAAGEPAAEYQVGITANLDSGLGVPAARAGQLLSDAARAGNAQAQYWVGSQVASTAECNQKANARVWFEHAAAGGSAPAAVRLARELLRGTPGDAELTQARSLLARAAAADSYYANKHALALLAAAPQAQVHDPALALQLAHKLAAGQIQSDPQLFEAIAAAYAVNGDFGKATAQQQLALRKATALGWNTRVMEERLAGYRTGRPWSGELLALPPNARP